ncbi:MAG: hypothetical protein Kow0077_25920 [Anaerolineae bacterium]
MVEQLPTVVFPVEVPQIHRGVWCPVPPDDPVIDYIARKLWPDDSAPSAWEMARLAHAVYLYRETTTHWTVVIKFYSVKTDESSAQRHAEREFECTLQARALGVATGYPRMVRPLAVWRGALFLEYVDGLTLQDVIAVRRHRPGTLLPALTNVAELLATFHTHSIQRDHRPSFETPPAKALKIVHVLVKYGVLHDDPISAQGLRDLIAVWAAKPAMHAYTPTFVHGDATTSNFVFPWEGGVVAIDWERFKVADPAADLGRLLAEITHSLQQHGTTVREALPDIEHTLEAYCNKLPPDWALEPFLERTRFYRAISLLRIARNGWVSREDRLALITQAYALLCQQGAGVEVEPQP